MIKTKLVFVRFSWCVEGPYSVFKEFEMGFLERSVRGSSTRGFHSCLKDQMTLRNRGPYPFQYETLHGR